MEIKIPKQQLLESLELVSKISTKHVTLPVLQCVLLSVKDSSLTIKVTNLEIGIETILEGKVTEEGEVAVPATVFLQTIQLARQEEITLRTEDTVLVVNVKNAETSIKSIPHEEFPTIQKVKGEGQEVNGHLFSLGIKTAAFAASQSSIKPELGSVFIGQKKEHSLTFVATDSFRLMEKTVAQKGVVLHDPLLVPVKNAVELSRVCDVKESNPKLVVDENQLSLEFGDGTYITSRLVAGTFPDYEQIIPKEYMSKVVVLREDLTHSFKKSNVFLNRFFQVTLSMIKDGLTVTANNGDVGSTTESMSASVTGEELTLSFNQRYITEASSHFAGDSLELHFAGIGRPLVIKGVSDSSIRYLVMPMNK